MRKSIIASLLLTMIFLSAPLTVQASSITVTLAGNVAHVTISSSFVQNMTRMPAIDKDISGSDLNDLANKLSAALEKTNAKATPTQVSAHLTSDGRSMNLLLSFDLEGVVDQKGDIVFFDLGWKSFHVPDDLSAFDIAYNLAGERYVTPGMRDLANKTELAFLVNKTLGPVPLETAANITANAIMLDLHFFNDALQNWNRTYDVENHITTWSHDAGPVVDITAQLPLNRTRIYSARLDPTMLVKIPGFAIADGDVVSVDQSDGSKEKLMILFVVASILLAFAGFFLERRVKHVSIVRKR